MIVMDLEFLRRARFGMLRLRCSEFIKKWPGSEFGPAHIVLDDSNFDDRSILFCLRAAFKELARAPNDPQLVATLVFLLKLSEESEEDREYPAHLRVIQTDHPSVETHL